MSWTYSGWTQDDSVNSGFPFASPSVPVQADFSDVKSAWKLKQNQNSGLPFINEVSPIDYDMVRSAWKMESGVNFGFPYIRTAFRSDALVLMFGDLPVQRLYFRDVLVWERNGINHIRILA